MLEKIISGGQTGVDRAALDVAILRGIPHGGYCPMGRLAEDGPIPAHYHLTELLSKEYPVRTRENVLAGDGTLILHRGRPRGGTAYTIEVAQERSKPLYLIDVDQPLNR